MANTPRKYMTSDEVAPEVPVWFHFNVGTLTADTTRRFVAPFDGCFNKAGDIILAWSASPDANAKNVEGDVALDGDTIFTTKPRVSGTASDDRSTARGGTGIRQPVLKVPLADRSFNRGDQIEVVFDESAAGGDPTHVSMTLGLTPFQDKEPDIRIAIDA